MLESATVAQSFVDFIFYPFLGLGSIDFLKTPLWLRQRESGRGREPAQPV